MKVQIAVFALCILATQAYLDVETVIKNESNEPIDTRAFWLKNLDDKKDAIDCAEDVVEETQELVEQFHRYQDGELPDVDPLELLARLQEIQQECKTLFCWEPTFEKCKEDTGRECEKYGLLVYPKCRDGYHNFGCCLCTVSCPHGFTDNGLYCLKPRAYGRGVGYTSSSKCKRHSKTGCEKYGLLYYPKCRSNYHHFGCCICSPNCPHGWKDIGISCRKPKSYGRGVGYPITAGLECVTDEPSGKVVETDYEDVDECELYAKQLVTSFDTMVQSLSSIKFESDFASIYEDLQLFDFSYKQYKENEYKCYF